MPFYIFPLLGPQVVEALRVFAADTCFTRDEPITIDGQQYDIFWPVDICHVVDRQASLKVEEVGQFDVILRVALAYKADNGCVIPTPREVIERLHQLVQPAPLSLHSHVVAHAAPAPIEMEEEAERAVRFAATALARAPLAQPSLRAALRASHRAEPRASAA